MAMFRIGIISWLGKMVSLSDICGNISLRIARISFFQNGISKGYSTRALERRNTTRQHGCTGH